VPSFRASALARAEIRETGAYTIHRWDEAQAGKYLGELEAFCQHLAEGRGVGRACDDVTIAAWEMIARALRVITERAGRGHRVFGDEARRTRRPVGEVERRVPVIPWPPNTD
jgi:plasmid stabilization system protein ParE